VVWCGKKLQMDMLNLAEILGKKCFKELVLQQNYLHGGCLKLLLSKFLSFGVVAGSLVYKLPQILKIQNNRSAKGVALLAVILEMLSVTISVAYNFNKGFPFMTYGESVFVAAFNILIICQILAFEHDGIGVKGFGGLVLYAAATYALLVGLVPFPILQVLQGCVTPIVIASRVPQIWESYRTKSTGQLSFITWFLNFAGSVARIFTTLQEVDDTLVLVGFLVGAALNGTIVAQIILYWDNQPAKRDKPFQTQVKAVKKVN